MWGVITEEQTGQETIFVVKTKVAQNIFPFKHKLFYGFLKLKKKKKFVVNIL